MQVIAAGLEEDEDEDKVIKQLEKVLSEIHFENNKAMNKFRSLF